MRRHKKEPQAVYAPGVRLSRCLTYLLGWAVGCLGIGVAARWPPEAVMRKVIECYGSEVERARCGYMLHMLHIK